MKLNYIGIVAGIIAFISLALPWWTMTMSAKVEFLEIEETIGMDVSVNTYDARATMKVLGVKESESIVDDFSIWYGYAALALIVIAGVAGIVGSLIVGKNGKMILVVAGILALLSIIIFAVGLQGELSDLSEDVETTFPGAPEISLIGSESFTSGYDGATLEMDYSSVLFIGFWLALVAAIIAFISSLKHPMAPPEAPPTPES